MSAHEKRNLRELQRYCRRLNRMIEDGSLGGGGQSRLVTEVRSLYQELLGVVPDKTLRSILAAGAVVVIGLSTACGDGKNSATDTTTDTTSDTVTDIIEDTDADMPMDTVPDVDEDGDPDSDLDVVQEDATVLEPSFAPVQENPFGLTPASASYIVPVIGDVDGDGDLDLFTSGHHLELTFYENTGTASAPAFAAPTPNPFGLGGGYNTEGAAFGDLDDDGDLDLLGGNDGAGGIEFLFWENTGTATAPAFAAPSADPYGLAPVDDWMFLEFLDLDGDGDLDLLTGQSDDLQYYENTGTASAPAFGTPSANPFGLAAGMYIVMPAASDLDGDGDLDLLVGGVGYVSYGVVEGFVNYYENTATASSPAFTGPTENPFGLSSTYNMSLPEFADIDGDGDDDLFVGESDGMIQFFENTTL